MGSLLLESSNHRMMLCGRLLHELLMPLLLTLSCSFQLFTSFLLSFQRLSLLLLLLLCLQPFRIKRRACLLSHLGRMVLSTVGSEIGAGYRLRRLLRDLFTPPRGFSLSLAHLARSGS